MASQRSEGVECNYQYLHAYDRNQNNNTNLIFSINRGTAKKGLRFGMGKGGR